MIFFVNVVIEIVSVVISMETIAIVHETAQVNAMFVFVKVSQINISVRIGNNRKVA